MFSMKWRLVVARILVIVLAGNPLVMAAHGIERTFYREAEAELTEQREQLRLQLQVAAAARAAAHAANSTAQLNAGQQAGSKRSANGTEVIDIAAPGQSGVSHNQFMQFNVTADGLILNNSQGPALSALGGWTDGNRRLAGGTARLILAEVTGSSRSSLLGYTEVLGDAAEFVLANPNGISCNGCGFINTPRVVLATGIADLLNGELLGINISGGDVVIDGAGLNASNVNKFDILTRAMKLNAALYANELNIRTGSNYYDYGSLQAQANVNQPDSNPAYQFALDASALGAMYANSISLIGTEAGLGVRSQGLISSVDSLQLTADGRLELKDTLAAGDLALRSQRSDVITSGSTYGQTVNIAAAGTLDNSGIIAAAQSMQLSAAALQQSGDVIAGINQQGEWQQGAEQQLNISGTAVNQGRIISSGAQQLTATEWQNSSAALLQGATTTLSATVLNNSGTLNSSALTLDSASVNNAGHIQAQQLSINAEQFTQTAGALYQTGADGRLSLTGRELQLDSGVLVAEGTAEVKATGQLRNNAAWLMAGDSTISAAELSNSGTVQLQGAADLTAASLNNSGNMLFAAEQATALSIKNTLDNQGGLLQFGTAAEVSAAEINNTSGQISHTGSGTLSLQAAQQLNNTAGEILSNGNMQISAADLNNQQGTLSAEQLTLTVGGDINNQAGTIQGTALDLIAKQLTNQRGKVVALGETGESLRLSISDVLDNSQGSILSKGRQLTLSSKQIINEQGSVQLTGPDGLALTATEQLQNNRGLIHSGGSLTLAAPLLSNVQGEIYADTIDATAATLNNQQGVIAAQQLMLSGGALDNRGGSIGAFSAAGKNLTLNFSQLIDNSAQGMIQSAGQNAELTAKQLRNNDGSIVLAGNNGRLNISVDSLDNIQGHIQANGGLLLAADRVNNQSGYIAALADISVAAVDIDNSAGQILADKLLLTTEQLTNTDGVIVAKDELNLHSPLLANLRGVISAHTLKLSGDVLDNTAGQLLAAEELDINTVQLTNSAGVINSQQNLQLSATTLNNHSGVIQGGNGFNAQVQGVTDNQHGQLLAGGNLQLHSELLHNAQGTVVAGGQLDITTTELQNTAAGVISADRVNIAAATVTNAAESRIEAQQFSLTAQSLHNAGTLLAAGQQGESLILLTDAVRNEGRIESHGENLSLTNLQLNNQQGQIYHLGTGVLQLAPAGELNNSSGEIFSAARLNIDGANINNAGGTLIAQQSLRLNAAELNNSDGIIQAAGNVVLSAAELNNRRGLIAAETDLQLAGTAINNNAGVIHAGAQLDISANNLINQGGEISAAGDYQLTIRDTIDNSLDGLLTATGAMSIAAGSVDNQSGLIYQQGDGSLLLAVDSTLNNNDGTIAADAGMVLTAAELTNTAGLLQGGALDISAGTLNNSAGVITSPGQLSLNSNAVLNNDGGQISAVADAAISAGQLSNNAGRIESAGMLNLNSAALNNDNGSVMAGDINLLVAGDLSNNQGTVFATDTLSIAAGRIDNTLGTVAANADVQLDVTTQLNNSGGLVQAAGNLIANAQQMDNSAGTIQAAAAQLSNLQSLNNSSGTINAQTLALNAATLDNSYGVILATDSSDNALQLTGIGQLTNDNGTIASHGNNWQLALDNLSNDNGKLLHLGAGTFTLSQAGTLNNSGTIASNANLVLNATDVANSGTLQAQQQLQLNAGLANQAGAVLVANDISVNAPGLAISNAGSVSANNSLQLAGASLNNSHLLFGGNNTAITAAAIDNSGTLSAANLDVAGFTLLQNSGRIESNAASYSGNTLDNQSGALLINAGNSANGLQLNVAQLSNSGTVHNSSLDMSLGGNLSNSGSIIHAGLGSLLLGSSGSINNAGGSIASAGTANIQTSIAGAGTVYAEQGMQLSSSGTFVNNSQLYSKGDILVTSALHNQGGSLLSDANLTINTSGNVTNSGTLQGQNLSLTSGALNNNAGTITSTGSGNAQISAFSLSNGGGIIQASNNNFAIVTRSGELNNSNGQINHSGSGSLTLESASHLNQQAGTVQSAGQLLVNAWGNLNNSYGVLSAGQYQLTASGSLNNNNGRIVSTNSSGSNSISSAALTNRSGHIAANGTNLTLTSAALDNNNGSILLAGLGNLAITASSIANDAAGARIISNGAISLSGGTLLTNAGQISAANLLSVNAATIANSGTLASRSGKVDIDSSGTLINSGTVSGASGVDIDVRTLNNSAGLLQSDGLLDIAVNSLSVGQMQARDIALNSKGNIALQSGEHISAGRNINLHSDADIINSGTIVANGTLDITGNNLTNNSVGVIRAGGNAVLDLNELTNNGTVSSNTLLRLDVKKTTNNSTLAAGEHLDINGNIDNRNLVFAGKLLTIDGNVSNTANIYSNRDAIISGTTVTNTGGSIAAAQDLSISGTIVNTHTGNINFVEGEVTTGGLSYVDDFYTGYDQHGPSETIKVTAERRTTTTYSAELSGTAGIIASGRNMHLDGHTTNNYSKISVGGDLHVTGTTFGGESASNQQIHQVEVYEDTVTVGCLSGLSDRGCAEPGPGHSLDEPVKVGEYTETTLTGGSLGTVYVKGNITGTLKDDVELNSASPLNGTLVSVSTNANGSSGSASRGNNATANSSGTVAVNRSSGTAKNTNGAERAASGLVAGNTVTVTAGWRDNNVSGPGNIEQQVIGQTPMQLTPVDGAVEGDNRQLNAGDLVTDTGISGKVARPVTTQGDVGQLQVTDQARQQVSIVQAGVSIQSTGFATLNVGNSLSAASANAPAIPQQQGGGMVGNGNIAGSGGYNPDLIIKGLVDNQQGTLTAQKGSAQQQNNTYSAGQPAGQNVFITDAQMRVLTEDLGFDANAINQGQQGLYAAISQNDLLADGVTLSAGGTIDITADGGFNINSGIAAGEGLILRSENGLEMGNFGFFDSDKLLGLQLGGDFTNNMNLQSDTLWLDIGGNFTNQGSLTGSDVLSISAGKDLINQNLLSGGKVILDAGGDIINRVEFSQHTVQNGNNSTTYTTVGKAPQIISNDSLSMTAGNNIDLQGSKFASAGDISLNAGNDVLLGAVEKLSGHEKYFKGGHDIELDRTYDVVSFDAGGNLSVVAGNNLQSEGAQFNAGGIAALAAGNDMNLLAVVESHYDADKKTKKSTFKKKVTENVSLHEEVQGTNITAANILLNATVDDAGNVVELPGGNITLVGGELKAEQNIIAFGDDITVTAGTYQDYDYSHTSKSSFGGLKSKSREDLAQDDLLAGSTLTADGNILLNAGNDIAILASELNGDNIGLSAFNEVLIASGEESSIRESRSKSGGFLSGGSLFSSTEALNGVASTTADSSVINASGNIIIDAGSATVIGSVLDADKGISVETDIGDIQVLAAKETTETYQYRKEMNVGFGDVAKVFSDPAGLLKDMHDESQDSGRVSLTIANADYLESETRTDSTQHKGSEIKAAGGVTFDSIGNINIEGSHIDADTDGDKEGALSLTAGGNVRVADVTDTYSETNKTTTGSAEVKVMVTHQAAEIANAAIAVKDAAEQLENTRRNYKTWMQQQDTLKATLTQLETELAQGKPGVNQGDIDDLRTQLDMLRTDEAWHLANIAVASENLVTATVNLTGQSITSAASSTTWGFNAGLSLDINASVSENQLLQSTSVGSTLSGAGVAIKTGSDGELAITGSTIDSSGKMVLDVGSLTMQAGVSTVDSQSQSKQGNINVSQTVWGAAAGGPSISGSLSMSEQRDHSTTYTNAGLSAAETMDITTQGDASLVGANILADEGLTANIGGDLTLQSVQNLNYGSNHGAGISGGMSFDGAYTNEGGANADPTKVTRTTAVGQAGDANSVNGGVNISNGRYYDKETLLSSITSGGPVDINVKGHTGITGALIASVDDKGNDTGNLNLNTGSLSFEDLTNTHYNTSSSVALNVSALPGDNTTAPPKGVTTQPQDSKGEDQPSGTTNLGLHSGSNYDKGKTLATVGNGNITVGGKEAEPEGLNRDVDAVDKELYSIERTKADLDLTVKNQTLKDAVDAVGELASLIDSFNKKSPEESAAIMAQVKHVTDIIQQLRDSDDPADWAKAKEFEAMVADLSVQLVALQKPLPEEEYRVADAPPMPEKSAETQQQEFDTEKNRLNDQFAAGQRSSEDAFENGKINGWVDGWSNAGNGLGSDINFDDAIDFYQNQSSQLRESLGLSSDAPDGWAGDALLWGGASLLDATYQTLQFGMNIYNYPTSGISPFAAKYDSLIGYDAPFGSPGSLAGVAGLKVGEMGSYIWEPAALLGGVAKLNGLRKVSEAGDIPPVGVVDKFDDIPPPSKYDINVSGGNPVLLDDLYGQTFESIPLSHLPNWKTGSLVNDGELGEQMALQLLNEKAGLNLKPLQNGSNWGCDGCAVDIKGDTITVVVVDAKSSVNGVGGAKSATGDPRTRLEGWLGNSSIANSDPALADALRTALRDEKVKVQGVTVKVGVPAPGTTGEATFKVEPWPNK